MHRNVNELNIYKHTGNRIYFLKDTLSIIKFYKNFDGGPKWSHI